ncbi:hypothetical protein KKG19_05040 [Patescibacteria group bacterium]|nr:hypothetical protein [Patescibacteria group bacterium]
MYGGRPAGFLCDAESEARAERTGTYYHADGILKKVSSNDPRDAWYFRVREMATVSIGVAQYQQKDDEDSLLGRVDNALFRAKEKGKDRSESEP